MTWLWLLFLLVVTVLVAILRSPKASAWIDARRGIDNRDHYLQSKYGLPIEIDGVNNLSDAMQLRDLQVNAVQEFEEQLHRVEDELTHHESSALLTCKLVLCLGAEWLGCLLLFRDLGLSGIEQGGLAALLACFLFYITGETVRRAGDVTTERTNDEPFRFEAFTDVPHDADSARTALAERHGPAHLAREH